MVAYCEGLALYCDQGAVRLEVRHLVGVFGIDMVLQNLHAVIAIEN